ncbi:CHASE3 domain-containing protein [Sorangium sp. So ce1128]
MTAPRWALSFRITAGFAFALLLFATAGYGGFRQHALARASGDWSLHTLEVLDQTKLVLAHLLDAETGQRGYILTGDVRYLEPYNEAQKTGSAELARLRELTADNPVQQQRLAALTPLVQAKLHELHESITIFEQEGHAAAVGFIVTDVGKQVMDRIRALLDAFQEEERTLLARRMASRAAQDDQVRLVIALATVLGVTVASLSLLRLNDETRRGLAATRRADEYGARLDTTLRSIGDAVLTTDVEGRIAFINPVAEKLTGWPLAEAQGQSSEAVFRIVNEETRATVESPIARVLREGITVGLANHSLLIAKDGRELPIDDSGAPIRDANHQMTGVVFVFRDVSDRKRAEEQRARLIRAEAAQVESEKMFDALRTAQARAEEANRSKDEFLAVLSHELRSPLNVMLGWVTLLKNGAVAGERAAHALEIIERNIHIQAQLVNDLLDVSRIISGKLMLESELVGLGAAVQHSVEAARSAAQAKGIELTFSIAPLSGMLTVPGDEKRLEQVFNNILTNAIKFTPRGGRVDVALAKQGEEGRVDVADTGRGIAPEFLPQVFDRFRQGDASSTRQHGGLGLGLSIVKTLVELHGGRVQAKSAGLGAGATFTVHLPLRGDPRVVPPPHRACGEEGRQLQGVDVVLVDDEHDTREVLGFALEQHGMRVYTCSSVGEALRVLDEVAPDVIVSDIGMPGKNGYVLLKEVRLRHGARSAAIAVTGFASKQDREQALMAGFDDHIAKPVTPDVLVSTIRQAVLRKQNR